MLFKSQTTIEISYDTITIFRWLANNGRKEDAEEVLLKIAKGNRRKISLKQREEIRTILSQIDEDSHQATEKNLSFLDMFTSKPNLKISLIMLLNWITINVGQYTLILNTTKLHGDIFVNFILSSLVGDMPGTLALIVTMKFFGRRFNLFYTQAIIGVCCVILAFLPKTVRFLNIIASK